MTETNTLREWWRLVTDATALLFAAFWILLVSFILQPIQTTRTVVKILRGDVNPAIPYDDRDLDWIDQRWLERRRDRE